MYQIMMRRPKAGLNWFRSWVPYCSAVHTYEEAEQDLNDILVDDWSKNCEAWEAAGGAAIKYEDATQASADLLRLFIKEREVA